MSSLENYAFVFIKPHAVTKDVRDLVENELQRCGRIIQQGSISAEDIDSKNLIDQHYYAIASKAVLLKPRELPVPADKFQEKFGEVGNPR